MADNAVTLTFTSDGVDGDIVKLVYARPDVGYSQTTQITFVNTVTGSDQVEITPSESGDPVGTAAATNFVVKFRSLYNTLGHFLIERDDNIVGIRLTNPSHFFNYHQNDLGTSVLSTIEYPESVDATILDQELTNDYTYCYLYEPLLATITDNSLDASRVFIDIKIHSTENGTLIETINNYAEFDVITGIPIQVDLMDIARQYHEANVYKAGLVSDISENWEAVVSKFKYEFIISGSGSLFIDKNIKKLPIIGGRDFQEFEPLVLSSTPLNEMDKFGVDLENKFVGYPIIETSLADPTAVDSRPTITVTEQLEGCKVKSAIIWKSYLGGWCIWGFKLENRDFEHKYVNNFESNIFESTSDVGGHIYKPVNYTGVETSGSITLKSLSLSSSELEACSRIKFSPAVYYVDEDGKMELMRVSSVTAPLDSKANGGDFTVKLKSIGSLKQATM